MPCVCECVSCSGQDSRYGHTVLHLEMHSIMSVEIVSLLCCASLLLHWRNVRLIVEDPLLPCVCECVSCSGQVSRVVVLADSPHGPQSHGILVGTGRVDVVERGGVPRISVAPREVNTDSEVYLTSSHDVVQE